MNEKKAEKILKDWACEDGSLHDSVKYLNWYKGNKIILLDGDFTAEELKAIAWWMENKK